MGKKRGPCGFVVYKKEQRPILKEKEPGLSFGDVARRLAQSWKALTPEERQAYDQKAHARRWKGKKAE
jgi:hypothetical protein